MKRVVLGAILMFIVVGLLSGCRFILGPGPSLELSELEGVWKLQPQHLGDMLEDLDFFYLEIEGDGTVRGWYEQGLWDEYTMSRADDRSYRGEIVRNPRDLGSVGADFNIDFELNGNELSAYYYPDDESWEWKPVFDRADSLPSGEYSHDFEDASYGAVEPHEPDGPKEWTIVERDGDRVLTPTAEDGNSDADIRIAPGENFSVEFQARRLENSQGYSWFAVDFNTYEEETGAEDDMSKWISSEAPNSFSFGNRDGEIDYSSYSFVAPWDTWHTYKITVQDGTEYQFFVDGGLVGQRSVPYGFIQGLKIEGNPDTGEWYFDDLEVTWNTEIEAATVDLSDRTVLTAREGNIVAMRPDGTGHYQLTSSPHWDWMPHWIDDGNKVVFVRSTDPDGEGGQDRSHDIYELDLADMSERVLLESDGQESYIDVSADHSQIVFHSTRDNLKDGDDGNDHLGDVYVMNADGSDVQNLTDTRDFDDLAPSFSPDGTKIAYASGENHPYAAWRIYTMNADGSGQTAITPKDESWNTDQYEANEPAWSPDGSTIVFQTVPFQDENHVGTIYTVSSSADGSDDTTGDDPDVLYDGAEEGAGSPTFNPDGSAIYFDRDGAIWTMKPDGSDAGELVPRPSDSGWYANYDFLQ